MLAERYGATRNTISRALAKLTSEGLLTCRPRVGYTVAPVIRNGHPPVKGHAIGLIVQSIPELGRGAFCAAVEQATADVGHALMIGASGNDARRESETLRRLAAAGMEALVITPARGGGRPVELEKWIRDGRPVVLLGHPGPWALSNAMARKCDTVDGDNVDGMRQILSFLAKLGHRTSGFVCQDPFKGSERFDAFRHLAPQFGIATAPHWQSENAGRSIAGARNALTAMCENGPLPSSIVCSHDDTALSVIEALGEREIQCPCDLSVTGFENGSLRGPDALARLTTVDVQYEAQARKTMQLLAKQFSGVRGTPEHVRIPVMLLDRGSAGVPRRKRSPRAEAKLAFVLAAAQS
jgi:DNA-binding LacI/PurR family transcriptional regulator